MSGTYPCADVMHMALDPDGLIEEVHTCEPKIKLGLINDELSKGCKERIILT